MKPVKNEEPVSFRETKIKNNCQKQYRYGSKEIILEFGQSFYGTHGLFFIQNY